MSVEIFAGDSCRDKTETVELHRGEAIKSADHHKNVMVGALFIEIFVVKITLCCRLQESVMVCCLEKYCRNL